MPDKPTTKPLSAKPISAKLAGGGPRTRADAKATLRPLPRPSRTKGPPTTTNERDYDSDEAEFLAAMDRYKREKRRPFPAWSEVLQVLLSLGYRKVGA